jgi:RNA polymerase sigma-70 factor (ECF subfamily)
MRDVEKLFESERPRLKAIAYRMLGTVSDAEDAVQQCFLRFRQIDPSSLVSPSSFLTTVVTRICVDELRSARARREVYPGTWLPEPIRTDSAVDVESVRMAFLVILETLSPEERAIYLLCEVFDYSHDEVAAILGKSTQACRQSLHRARERVSSRRPRFAPPRETHARIVEGFLLTCRTGDVEGIRALLADDAVASADGGGKVPAAQHPVLGRQAVARFLAGLARLAHLATGGPVVEIAEMNGDPAVVMRLDGRVDTVILLEVDAEMKICAVRFVRNPEKLARV